MAKIVYIARNTVNNKVYVGVTMNPLQKRVNHHRSCARRGFAGVFYAAIRKYGFEAFKWEVASEHDTNEAMFDAEKTLILSLKSTHRDRGYNMSLGGEGSPGVVVSDATRQRQSEARRGKATHRPGWGHTDEHKARVAESLRGKPSRARKLPVGAEAALLARYVAGESQAAMAREMGVNPATITKAIARARA